MNETNGVEKTTHVHKLFASCEKFYGKYKGTVVNNIDPKQMGRLLVSVPDVLTTVPSSWAEPCVPLAGPTGPPMGAYFVPPIGAGVWVEFEQGDPNYPIWVGCRWGTPADPPTIAKLGLPVSPSIVLQTMGQSAIAISDTPGPTGGIMLKTLTGAMILVNDLGIIISNGKGAIINMVGPSITIGAATVGIIGNAPILGNVSILGNVQSIGNAGNMGNTSNMGAITNIGVENILGQLLVNGVPK